MRPLGNGLYELADGRQVRLVDWRDDFIYDTTQLPTSITGTAEYNFFKTTENKDKIDTNIVQAGQLPDTDEMIIRHIGIHIKPKTKDSNLASADMLADRESILNLGYVWFQVGHTDIVRSGPAFLFPSGYGLWGSVATADTTTAGANQWRGYGVAQNGVPSPGAVPPLEIPIYLTRGVQFRGGITFYEDVTLSVAVDVYMILRGWIKRPVR